MENKVVYSTIIIVLYIFLHISSVEFKTEQYHNNSYAMS